LLAQLKPKPSTGDRQALVASKLTLESKAGRAIRVELTEAGWAWAAANTRAIFNPRAYAQPVLVDLLARLGAYLDAHGMTLAAIIRPAPSSPGMEHRVRAAYLSETGGSLGRRARLAHIRNRLADVPRPALDAALLDLAAGGRAILMPIDDLSTITPSDHEAALQIGGFSRHLLWFDA
jgi:hypothetical protein